MQEPVLKSSAFRLQREANWLALDALVQKVETRGLRALTPDDLMRLPVLYRAAVSSLSVARSISLDANLVAYLESLVSRSFFCVYGTRSSLAENLALFFRVKFPAAVRAAGPHILLAAVVMLFGAVVGFWLTSANADWYYTLVPKGLAGERSPASGTEDLRRALYDGGTTAADQLYLFASFLFTHNAKIGMLSFALGFAFGLPTLFLLFTNGLTLGAFVALYAGRGLTTELFAWLLIHGATELTALCLCGGAGLALGAALTFPGERSRLAELARRGRQAGLIIIGAVFMFFAAGLLEGIGRQIITDVTTRYAVAALTFALWIGYFALSGKESDHVGDD